MEFKYIGSLDEEEPATTQQLEPQVSQQPTKTDGGTRFKYIGDVEAIGQEFFSFEDAISAIGTIPEALAVGIPAAFQKLVTGLEIPEESEAIEREIEFQQRMQKEQADRVASGKATVFGSAVRAGAPSYSGSFMTMGAAIPAGIGGAIAGGPAAKITGPAAAMAASGTVAYRMAGSDLMYRAYKQLENKKGSPLTDEEKAEFYKTILPIAQNAALWEAGPEAVSNAISLGVGRFVFGFGKGTAKQVVNESIEAANKTLTRKIGEKSAAIAGGLGAEIASEGVTAMGQFPQEKKVQQFVETGTTEGAETQYPGGYLQAVKDVAPATTAVYFGMGAVGGGAKLATLPFQRQKSPEQIEEDNINLEAERVSRELSVGETDEETKGIVAALNTARDNLAAKKEVYTALEPTDPAAQSLGMEIRQMERDVAMLDAELRKRTGEPLAQAEAQQAEIARGLEEPVSATITQEQRVTDLRAVSENTATPEQIASLSQAGLVDVIKGKPVVNEDGEAILAQAQAPLPRLTPEERVAEIEGEAPVAPAPAEGVTETPEQRYSRLLAEAEPFSRPGTNYNRNIASSYERLKAGVESGSTLNEPRAEELEIRLRKVQPAPASTIREEPQVSPMIGAEPTQPAPAEGVTPAPETAAEPDIRRAAVEEEVQPVPAEEQYTPKQAQSALKKLFGRKIPDRIKIINDPENKRKAGYFVDNGEIELNLAYLKKTDNLEDIITHEIGHFIYPDPEFQKAFQSFWEAIPDDKKENITNYVKSAYSKDTGEIQIEEAQVIAFEKIIARSKRGVNWWTQLKDIINRIINRIFGTDFEVSDHGAMAVLAAGIKRYGSGERIIRETKKLPEGSDIRMAGVQSQDARFAELEARAREGDKEAEAEAQRMVDEAAKAAGYGMYGVHRTTEAGITEFKKEGVGRGVSFSGDAGFYFAFSENDQASQVFGNRVYRAYLKVNNPAPVSVVFKNVIRTVVPESAREAVGKFFSRLRFERARQGNIINAAKTAFQEATQRRINPERMFRADAERLMDLGYDGIVWSGDENITAPPQIVVFTPNQIKSADPFTYDDAGNLIPLSQRFQPTERDIRRMAVEPRREQEAGIKNIGKIIDTPVGINRRTEEVIRRDVFNSDEVNPEQTAKAYDLIDRLSRDPKEANNYADEINELTRKELSAEENREVAQTIGAVKLGNELFKYAVNLAAKGDIRMLQLLTERFNDLATGAGGIGQDARNLQARQNLASWVKRAAESQKTGIVNAVAIQIYGPGATQEQIDTIRDAVNAVNKTKVEDADAIYTDLEETGSRTGVEIRKAVEKAMDKADASSKDPWVMALEIVKAIEGFQKFTYEGLTISVPQNIKNLVSKNLANYRKKMKTKGADGLEKTFWKTMSDQEDKMGPLGEVDMAVGRNLAGIVKDTLIKLGLKGEPPDTKMTLIEQVANILSNNELSTDRMAEADKRISEEIAARRGKEVSDAEDANASPEVIDAIEAKWEGIQQAWDESMSRQMDIPISDATLRRLISNELKEDNTTISQFVKEVGDDIAISNARKGTIINKIISKLNGLNEDGSTKRDYTKLEEFLSSQFDQMVSNQKLKNRMRSAVKKVAKEADPNKQAERQIERLAELQSDVQRWPQKREDKVRDIVSQDLRNKLDLGLRVADKIKRNWKPVLVDRLVNAGVDQSTAGILADIVWRQHEINYLNRKMAQVERAVTRGSLAPIIDAIKNTPLAQQQDPAWKRKVAYDYLINAGLDAKTAGRLADLMDTTLQKVLAAAQAKAFEDTLKGKLGDQRSRRGMEKFLRAIRTGAIDPTKNITSEIAAANGWTGFTSEQYARLSELDSIVNDKKKTDLELAAAYKEIQDILADAKLQPRVREALAAYYTANALSGIPTATVNIFSPIGFSLRNLMTDTIKNLATNPAALPTTFDTFVSSWKTYFSEVAFSFKNNVQRRGVVEYLSNDDILLRLYNKGKKQWQQGQRAEGMKNMIVGMMEYVGRMLKALDEGAVSVLEQQGLTRYAMDAMQKAGIPAKDARAAANAVLSQKQAFIEEMVAKGVNKTQARAMSDDVFRSAWVEALTNFEIPSQQVLNASLNDALASIGRINNTFDALKKEDRNIRDLGFASAPPIGLLERLGESLNSDKATETQKVFYRMVYGFAIVPARVFREAAWFSPYGFVRFAVNSFSKRGGGAGRYAQSLGTDAQFRQRMTETIAGTAVLGAMLALSKGSDEDPFDELPFKIVVTGNGPERRLDPQFYDSWNKKYKRNALHVFFGKTKFAINIERGFEAFAIPFMLAGAYDDMKIRKRFEASKATPSNLTDASILLGAAFTSFNQRGPYAAFMDGLIRSRNADDAIPALARQAMFVGKTFIPGVGTSLARNVSDFISDPVDRRSMEGALWSNVPVIGPMIGTKSMNALGQTTGPKDLSDRMYKGGLPIVFDLPSSSRAERLRDLVISKGQGPDIPTRYDVRRRLGYEPTNKQYEVYVTEYGKYMADRMDKAYNSLRRLEPRQYVRRLQSYQTTARLMGERAAKKIGNPDQP